MLNLLIALTGLGVLLTGCSGPVPVSRETSTAADHGVASAVSAASGGSGSAAAAPLGADWPTYHGDVARSGVAQGMPTPRGLSVIAMATLDAPVYASPLVVGGEIIAATERNTVYAISSRGVTRWRTHLGDPSPAAERPCGNIDPLGITGTPVAAAGVVYAVTEYAGGRHELVVLDLATGEVLRRTGLDLPGTDQLVMQQRAALTISGGRVWVAFGGLAGDCGRYLGRVIGVPVQGSGGPLVSYTVPTTREGGIWTPPGPSVNRAGDLLVSVGNGEQGTGGRYDLTDSILQLDVSGRLVDSFSPSTWQADNDADLDLGSQGPALVGDRWVVIAGKSGTGYVLRQGRLGGIGGQVWAGPVCTSFGGPAVQGDVVYLPCTDGIRAARVSPDGALQLRWQAAAAISGSPVIGGGRIWSLEPGNGVLHALDPATGRSVLDVEVGPVTRFATPALSGSQVIVPTTSGLTLVALR